MNKIEKILKNNKMKLIRIFFLCITASLILISCDDQKKFVSEDWKQWAESENNPGLRWQMHKDLLSKYNLKTCNKDQVLELLGNPNSEEENEYHYLLGYSGKGINTGKMIVIFENDLVVDIKIIEG